MSRIKKGAISSFLLIGESVLNKMVGLVSTLILARVLVPEDFGLVAIAGIVISFIDVLSTTGGTQYLMCTDKLDKKMVNTSWTITFILKGALATIMVLISPWVADFYGDDRLIAILWVMSGIVIIQCLGSPGPIFYRREQNYKPIVKVTITGKLVSVAIAVSIALIYESYWALIIGQLASASVSSIGGYIIHTHRPAFTLQNAKAQWEFSGWMIPQALVGHVRTQLDTFLVSANFGKSEMGSYHVMKYLTFIPCSHILLPITQPLLVELATIKNNRDYFSLQFNASLIVTMLIALPMSFMMFFHDRLFTGLFLGQQWLEYSSLLGAFALLIPAFALLNQARRMLIVFNKAKHMLYYEIISFCILYGVLILVGLKDIQLFTVIRVSLENILCTVFLLYAAARYTGLKNTLALVFTTLPVFIICFFAGVFSTLVNVSALNLFFQLIVVGSLYCAFTIAMLVMFHYAGMRHTREWKYVEGIINRGLMFIKGKLIRPASA